MTPKTEKNDSAFSDVSGDVKQAKKDAEAPVEVDNDGEPLPRTSEAAGRLEAEQNVRASAQANGGGPWPPELLRKNFIGNAAAMQRDVGPYTSHETD